MKGNFYRPHPLDFVILERLPIEGSQIGYHVLAKTVKRLREDLNDGVPEEGRVTTSQVTARLRSMFVVGHVAQVPVMGSGGVVGWQRTRKGSLHYSENTGEILDAPALEVVSEDTEQEREVHDDRA